MKGNKRIGLEPKQVLSKLYEELKGLGECKREFKGKFILEEFKDYYKTLTCWYDCDCVINNVNGNNYVFTYGKTRLYSELAQVDEAVMYAKINLREILRKYKTKWNALSDVPKNATIEELTDKQVYSVVNYALDRDRLIFSWENQLFIQDGFDSKKWLPNFIRIPSEFVASREVRPTQIGYYGLIPFLLEKEMKPEEIKAEGLVPSGHQRYFYKEEVVEYLLNHIKNSINIDTMQLPKVYVSLRNWLDEG
jgi:hypothetical protein